MPQHETAFVRQYFISANVSLHSLLHYFHIIKCLMPTHSQKQQQCYRVLYAAQFDYRINISIQGNHTISDDLSNTIAVKW